MGHFLSPDALVPEAGNALDYHRYAYVRFNPLKYEDGSGHCATLANGQADENDAECWRLARTIANLWNDTDYWRTRFGELDVWNNHIAPSAVTAEFMQDEPTGICKAMHTRRGWQHIIRWAAQISVDRLIGATTRPSLLRLASSRLLSSWMIMGTGIFKDPQEQPEEGLV